MDRQILHQQLCPKNFFIIIIITLLFTPSSNLFIHHTYTEVRISSLLLCNVDNNKSIMMWTRHCRILNSFLHGDGYRKCPFVTTNNVNHEPTPKFPPKLVHTQLVVMMMMHRTILGYDRKDNVADPHSENVIIENHLSSYFSLLLIKQPPSVYYLLRSFRLFFFNFLSRDFSILVNVFI